MNNCQQRAWFWEMGGSWNSIWLLLKTEGARFITKSNLSTVLSTDYIFLYFLSHKRFYAPGFILPLLQSLGRNYGLITLWTRKWMWLTEPYPLLGFSSYLWGDGGNLFQSFTSHGCLASMLVVELRLWLWNPSSHPLQERAALDYSFSSVLQDLSSTRVLCCHYSSYKSLPKMKTWP